MTETLAPPASIAAAPLWTPTPQQCARANMTRFIAHVRSRGGATGDVSDFTSLYRWSVDRREDFWSAVWDFCRVIGDRGDRVAIGADRMAPPDPEQGPRWFPDARLNFAENLLRWRDEREAIVFWNEEGARRRLTFAELAAEVARVAAALRASGVAAGDRVAGYLPNLPETVIAMLATASIGAIWSSCSPDFGVAGVLDRFGQIKPRVLFCADAYLYSGREIDCLERTARIVAEIPEIERVVVVPYRSAAPNVAAIRGAVLWEAFCDVHGGESGSGAPAPDPSPAAQHDTASRVPRPASLSFERLPFDHPLYMMYSSGTTGLPKCMVHGAGGTLLQHLKEHVLHTDLTRDDRIFYFTTCGWMMWNWLVSALAVGATLVLYDGAPLLRRRAILWDMATAERITVFGTSAKWLALAEKEGLRPAESHDLGPLRAVLSTGSPLAAHSFDYVYTHVKPDVQLSSISGGTDIISCFALGNPIGPVYRGEIQTRGLGMAVEIFDAAGQPTRGAPGELVCTAPFPSMPVAFWNDPTGEKYRAAYFAQYAGVWRHGDWAELTDHNGIVIYGRSDATLNPGGVRIGTAEIYRQVEQLPEVIESLVVGQEIGARTGGAGEDVRVVLFVRLAAGVTLTEALKERIRQQIRANTSPHHIPKKILQVADIPRTISGKITELAVRDVIHGRPVKNVDALANPDALKLYENLAELKS